MAVRYYDDAIIEKLKRWMPENSNLRVLRPDEVKRLVQLHADDDNDKPITLPCIALSRRPDIKLSLNIKNSRSYDGLKVYGDADVTAHLNIIPINVEYQLDIYTKTEDEGDEYLRTFLFKLINNPVIKIMIPYNDAKIEHIANIRVLDQVSDTSGIPERLFSGQFNRWTIQMEIQDAFLFNIPYKQNWQIIGAQLEIADDLITKDCIVEPIKDFNNKLKSNS